MRSLESKIRSRTVARADCEKLRAAGKKIVFTNGAFDILHAGHVDYLNFARLMEGATEIKCSEFGTAVIEKM